ncbi:MAG: prepilin-type N-terminal cleavage/methylation domain-containing protein [Planctomycetes bacterium]|nr:prepilin-type N-terminal cleavage/methylation domain-containing protein [Planctomycetota bacterium]
MKRRGFTLLELLVVISIIGVLIGIALPALMSAKRHSKEKACRSTITQIDTALSSYETKFADYPPSGMFVKGANDLNWGSESLVWHLFTTQKGGPYLDMSTWEEKLINVDADATAKAPDQSTYMKNELMELGDEFKNPFIYIHNRDYAKPSKYGKYTIGGKEVDCVPQKSPKTGNYHSPGKYMLWSAGGDGENQNGGEEDIASWN